MLGKLPPCPGKANKTVKDHLSSGQTVEREQTQGLLFSDKHTSDFIHVPLVQLLAWQIITSTCRQTLKDWGVSESQVSLLSPQGHRSTILKIAGKAR